MSLTPVKIALLGLGNVGAAVFELLQKNADVLRSKSQNSFQVKHVVVRDLNKSRAVESQILTTDLKLALNDPEVQIVVELMGDVPQALGSMRSALASGKHVVTANKALVARHGRELFELARQNNVKFLFEASVGGGIPVLRVLREGVSANHIQKLRGIINGTTNFILTQMSDKGAAFDDVLKQAQDLGYAEADPTSDVDGFDVAAKLSILVMLAYGQCLPVSEIPTQGIRKLCPIDFKMAREFDYAIKLMGLAEPIGDSVLARVTPVLVSRDNPIAHVRDAFNAIQYVGDHVGVGMLYGRGAGGGPTASAVVSDLLEVCRSLERQEQTHSSPTGYAVSSLVDAKPLPVGEMECPFYVRLSVVDRPNVLAQIMTHLGSQNISIRHVYQHGNDPLQKIVPVIVFTHKARESQLLKALGEIDKLESVVEASFPIPIVDE